MEAEPAEPEKRARVPGWLKAVLKIAFSAGVLGWFAWAIDLEKLELFVANASWPLMGGVALICVLRVFVGGWRFHLLLRPLARVPISTLSAHIFVGFIYNNFLPSAVGGDAVRVLLLDKEAPGVTKTESATLIFVERIQGLWALWLMGAIAAPFAGLAPAPAAMVWTCVGLTFGLSALGILLILKAPDRRFRDAWRAVLTSPRDFLLALLGSWLFQWSAVFVTWLVARAFGIDLPQAAFYALIPLVYLATLAPISFGGVGLREAASVYLFGTLGVSMEASLILALGNYLTLLIPGAVGVGVQLAGWIRGRRQRRKRG